jgi:hypothetical protein
MDARRCWLERRATTAGARPWSGAEWYAGKRSLVTVERVPRAPSGGCAELRLLRLDYATAVAHGTRPPAVRIAVSAPATLAARRSRDRSARSGQSNPPPAPPARFSVRATTGGNA